MGLLSFLKRHQAVLTVANSLASLLLLAAGIVVAVLAARGAFHRTAPAKIVLQSVERIPNENQMISLHNVGDEDTQVTRVDGGAVALISNCLFAPNTWAKGPCSYSLPSNVDELPEIPAHSTRAVELNYPEDCVKQWEQEYTSWVEAQNWPDCFKDPILIAYEKVVLHFASGQLVEVPLSGEN